MPRKDPSQREAHWIPVQSRAACYRCGVAFSSIPAQSLTSPAANQRASVTSPLPSPGTSPRGDLRRHSSSSSISSQQVTVPKKQRNNCRLCYDVFCAKCWGDTLLTLPTDYGYHDSQPVCVSCALLATQFPLFSTALGRDRSGGGQLLMPGTTITVCKDVSGDVSRDHSASAGTPPQPSGGLFSKFKTWISSDAKKGGKARGIKPLEPCSFTLVGWRPLNPETAIIIRLLHCSEDDEECEAIRIPLRELEEVALDEDDVSIRLVTAARTVHICVGSTTTATPANRANKDDVLFVMDADGSGGRTLCNSLKALWNHSQTHYAFSKASLAMLWDKCPESSSPNAHRRSYSSSQLK